MIKVHFFFLGRLWLCEEDRVREENVDLLRYARVCSTRDHLEQRPRHLSRLLVSGHPHVWALNWQVHTRWSRSRPCATGGDANHLLFFTALRSPGPIRWKPTTSSWEVSTWLNSQRKLPKMLPTSSKSYAGEPFSFSFFISKVTLFIHVFFFCRDNPSERLGNLKNGVKDIQKHKYAC